MTSRVQQQRAEASNTPPPANSLLPGQLYVELADPMKLWAGTPTSLAPTQAKVLFDSTAYLKLTGGVMSGNLTLSNNPPAPQDAVPRSYVDSASGSAVPLTGGTMTGPLILSGPPIQPLQAAPKNYVDTMVPLAGGTMTGLLTLSGPPTAPLGAVTKAYSDLKLPLAGGTMTGNLILNADPVVPLGAVTKQYIDNHPAVVVGDTPPASPNPGALWWDSVGAQLYVNYQDPNSTAWIIANQSGLSDAPNDANTYGRHANAWATVATAAQANANAGRNMITNGTFVVAQRGTGPWSQGYTADRWSANFIAADVISYTIVTLTDADRAAIGNEAAMFGLQNTFTGSAAAGSGNLLVQRVEGLRRLSGKTATVSFWAKATGGTPSLGVGFAQNFGTGGSPSAQVTPNATAVAISASWARYSVTFTMPSTVGKVFGTNGDDNTELEIWYSSSATFAARAAIGVQSGTIQLWGVQLEIGSQPTVLDPGGSPQAILAECQRFYLVQPVGVGGPSSGVASGATGLGSLPLLQTMRATPTVTLGSTGYGGSLTSMTVGGNSVSTFAITGNFSGANTAWAGGGTITASADL